MVILREPIVVSELKKTAESRFGDLVKAVVDLDRKVMAIGGELHSDEEGLLLDDGSQQKDLWGINLYPDDFGTEAFLEFDSIINLRPSQGNKSRGVDDAGIRAQITRLVAQMVTQ